LLKIRHSGEVLNLEKQRTGKTKVEPKETLVTY